MKGALIFSGVVLILGEYLASMRLLPLLQQLDLRKQKRVPCTPGSGSTLLKEVLTAVHINVHIHILKYKRLLPWSNGQGLWTSLVANHPIKPYPIQKLFDFTSTKVIHQRLTKCLPVPLSHHGNTGNLHLLASFAVGLGPCDQVLARGI